MIGSNKEIDQLLNQTLAEDIQTGDLTTLACIPADARCVGQIIQKQAGVVAGLSFFRDLLTKFDQGIEVTFFVTEGSYQKSGTVLGKIEGPTQSILTVERAALNLLQHTSGVATLTAEYVRRIKGYDCTIIDSRKTLPGLRALEKYAVGAGGGMVHRQSLNDRLLIKVHHLRFFGSENKRPVKEVFQKVRDAHPDLPIDLEIDQVKLLSEALATDAHAIILRNMFPHDISQCVRKIRFTDKRVYVNCGSTITLDTIRSYADTGVDGIFIGSLIHSAPSLDIAIRLS